MHAYNRVNLQNYTENYCFYVITNRDGYIALLNICVVTCYALFSVHRTCTYVCLRTGVLYMSFNVLRIIYYALSDARNTGGYDLYVKLNPATSFLGVIVYQQTPTSGKVFVRCIKCMQGELVSIGIK